MAFSRYAAAPAVDFVSAFATAAGEVASLIPLLDLGARVPACPRWSTYDLVLHLGNVHGWAATIVETGHSAPEQDDEPSSQRARAVASWYTGKAEDLLQVLRAAHPEDACWTFSDGHRTEAFWPRRQAHETWVHLVDLEQVLGRTSDIPASLAADGVDEVLDVFLPRMHSKGRPARLSAPLLLDATDTDDAWLLTPSESGDGPPLVERLRDDGPGRRGRHLTALGPLRDDAPDRVDAVRAAASDLMLLLWKRRSPDHRSIILDGDRSRLLAFLRSPLTP